LCLELFAEGVQGIDRGLIDRVALLGPVQGRDHAIGTPFDQERTFTHPLLLTSLSVLARTRIARITNRAFRKSVCQADAARANPDGDVRLGA
jgi:hypothetical protein